MRLEITRKSDLAVRALGVLAARGRTKGSDLADAIESTPGFLSQVMTPMVHAGWIGSEPGPTGGYRLLAALDRISVLDVIELFEGPTDTEMCVLRGGPCQASETCALHEAWAPARAALLERLAATSVARVAVAS